MSSETLKQIAANFKEIEPAIAEAEDLIAAMKEAGETTATMEANLRTLKIKKDKNRNLL